MEPRLTTLPPPHHVTHNHPQDSFTVSGEGTPGGWLEWEGRRRFFFPSLLTWPWGSTKDTQREQQDRRAGTSMTLALPLQPHR